MPEENPARILALTAFGEASDQGFNGMQAVVNTVINRAANPGWWGKDVESVCLAKDQYDCWNDGPDRTRMLSTPETDPTYQRALMLANMAIAGGLPDITGGADSYYADTIEAPDWTKSATFTVQIGSQKFYITERKPVSEIADPVDGAKSPEPAADVVEGPIPIPIPPASQE